MKQLVHDTEILADKLQQDHGGCLTALACLYYLTREYLHRLQKQHNRDMTPIITILTQSMGYWSIANGYTRQQCSDALADVERTMSTAAYLASYTTELAQDASEFAA